MALYVSDQNTVLFQYESGTYATPSGGKHWIGLVTDHSPTDAENVVTVRYAGQSNRNAGQFISTMKDYDGTITFHPQNFRMFGFALGSTVDSGSPSPYNHLISELNSDGLYAFTSGANKNQNFPSFTVIDSKKGNTDGFHQVRTYKGCVTNSIELSFSNGNPTECTLNYMAQSLTLGSKTTDLPTIAGEDTSRPYIFSDVKIHLPSGTVVNEITDGTLTISNNLERRHYDNGSVVADNFTPTNRDYELSLTLDANSVWGKTLYEQYWQGGSTFNAMIEAVISTGSEQGFFVLSGCKITSFESPSPSEGIQEYSATIMPQTCTLSTDDLIQLHNPW